MNTNLSMTMMEFLKRVATVPVELGAEKCRSMMSTDSRKLEHVVGMSEEISWLLQVRGHAWCL